MVDDDAVADQDGADRRLVRPYIQGPGEGYRLPEGTAPGPSSPPPSPAGSPAVPSADSAAVPPASPAPADSSSSVAGSPSGPSPSSDTAELPPVGGVPPDDGRQDRRQMAWLAGAGLALVIAIGVTMVALWPGADDSPSVAAPPGGFTWPARPSSTAPAPSAAPASASAGTSPSPSGAPSAGPSAPSAPAVPPSAPVSPSAPPSAVPPSATLAPPPAADRVGPITGAGGACLDVTTGIVLPGTPVAVRGCNGTLSQRWTVAADGTLRVSGTCAVADGAAQVAVGPCGDAASGQWRAGAGGTLVNVASGQCLTGPADGNRVRVAACGTGSQAWALP